MNAANRRAEAASRKAANTRDRHNRRVVKQADKELKALGRAAETAVRRAREFDEKLQSDPIKALDLAYIEGVGFQSKPYNIDAGVISGEIFLIEKESAGNDDLFQPSRVAKAGFKIELLELGVLPYGSVLAIKVEALDPSYKIRLNWVKARTPQESAIYLIDKKSGSYYYPKATDLRGEVVPGSPRIGLVVFDPFRVPTDEVELHLSGVKLTATRGEREDLVFPGQSTKLAQRVAENLAEPSLGDAIEAEVARVTEEQANAIEVSARKQMMTGGCGCGVALWILPFASAAAMWLAAG